MSKPPVAVPLLPLLARDCDIHVARNHSCLTGRRWRLLPLPARHERHTAAESRNHGPSTSISEQQVPARSLAPGVGVIERNQTQKADLHAKAQVEQNNPPALGHRAWMYFRNTRRFCSWRHWRPCGSERRRRQQSCRFWPCGSERRRRQQSCRRRTARHFHWWCQPRARLRRRLCGPRRPRIRMGLIDLCLGVRLRDHARCDAVSTPSLADGSASAGSKRAELTERSNDRRSADGGRN